MNRFNQFEGKESSYDENLYTSKLDASKITNKQREQGMKLEREITKEATISRHLMEERGQVEI